MATISPETLATELRFREKRQNYAGMLDSISLSKKETNAARNAAGGESVGATQAGLESMVQIYDNAVDVAESTAKTIIAKVAPTGHDLEAQLHPRMTDAEIASLDAIMKNAAVTVTEIFGPAIAAATASSKMNHKIYTDSSPDAAVTALKKATKIIDNDKLETVIKGLLPDDLKSLGKSAVEKMQSKEIQADVANVLTTVDSELKKATSGISSGNLLKDITEDVSRNLSTTIGSFGDEFTRLTSLPIINDLLGGNNALGLDKAISTLKIDPSLLTKARQLGIGTNISGLLDMKGFLKSIEKLAPELETLSTALKTSTDNAITALDKAKTSVASIVSDTNNTSPHETADVADTTKEERFKTLSSIEEIISVLKSSKRPLTTIVWHWSGHYTDDGNIGAQEILNEYRTIDKNIPFHFVIMKNGDIQTGFPINNANANATDAAFLPFSFGVVFVGGYNGPRGGLPGGVKLDSKSYTAAQWKSFNTMMKAFYTFAPGGDAFGQNDLGNDPGEGPGFSVSDQIALAPFYKKNACNPELDKKFLSREEIIARQKIYSVAINELQDIQ
jgi:hypothetical protein